MRVCIVKGNSCDYEGGLRNSANFGPLAETMWPWKSTYFAMWPSQKHMYVATCCNPAWFVIIPSLPVCSCSVPPFHPTGLVYVT